MQISPAPRAAGEVRARGCERGGTAALGHPAGWFVEIIEAEHALNFKHGQGTARKESGLWGMRKERPLSSASPRPIATTAHGGCAPRGCSSSPSSFWGACVPRAVLGGQHGWWQWFWVLGDIRQWVWDAPRGRRGGQRGESPVIPPRPSLSHRVGRSGGGGGQLKLSMVLP